MAPHDYSDWTRVGYHNGTVKWYRGFHYSITDHIAENIDAVVMLQHYQNGVEIRVLKIGG